MLDGDLYGNASNGVANSGSGGGSQSLPGSGGVTGAGAVGGAPASAVVSACSNYCPRYGTQCINRLGGQDCMRACEDEMTGFGQKCQTLGLKALACLAPFFTVNGVNCDAAVKNALAKCTKEVTAFNDCKNKPAPPPR